MLKKFEIFYVKKLQLEVSLSVINEKKYCITCYKFIIGKLLEYVINLRFIYCWKINLMMGAICVIDCTRAVSCSLG